MILKVIYKIPHQQDEVGTKILKDLKLYRTSLPSATGSLLIDTGNTTEKEYKVLLKSLMSFKDVIEIQEKTVDVKWEKFEINKNYTKKI